MRITPLDIQQQRFRTTFRGLDRAEVDAFLNLVASEVEALNRENHEVKEELRRARSMLDQFHERETALKETMITAQRVTDDIKHAARKDAEVVVRSAELEGEKILQNAHARLVALLDDINELKRQRAVLSENLRSTLNTHQRLLELHNEEDAEARSFEEKLKVLRGKPRVVLEDGAAPEGGKDADKRRGAG